MIGLPQLTAYIHRKCSQSLRMQGIILQHAAEMRKKIMRFSYNYYTRLTRESLFCLLSRYLDRLAYEIIHICATKYSRSSFHYHVYTLCLAFCKVSFLAMAFPKIKHFSPSRTHARTHTRIHTRLG